MTEKMSGASSESDRKEEETSPSEREVSSERLSAAEILATPGIYIAIFGTSDGLGIAFALKTERPTEETDGERYYTLPLQPQFKNELETNPKMIEVRGNQTYTDIMRKRGYATEQFRDGNILYHVVYIPSEDIAHREGVKGIIIGWDKSDETLDRKMFSVTTHDSIGMRTIIDLWTLLYSNRETTAFPHKLNLNRTNPAQRDASKFFSPPDFDSLHMPDKSTDNP